MSDVGRYMIAAHGDKWLVVDTPKYGVSTHGYVVAECPNRAAAGQVAKAMELAWGKWGRDENGDPVWTKEQLDACRLRGHEKWQETQ